MNARGPAVVWGVLGFVIGSLPAFVLAGPSFFSDGPLGQRLVALGLYGVAVFVIGLGGGALAGPKRGAVTIGLGLAIVSPLLLLSTAGTITLYALGAAFVFVAFGAAWIGTLLGARITQEVIARRKG